MTNKIETPIERATRYMDADAKRDELIRASTPENVERLVEAVRVARSLFAKDHAIDHFDWGKSSVRAEDIRELNDAPFTFAAALAPFKGVKP